MVGDSLGGQPALGEFHCLRILRGHPLRHPQIFQFCTQVLDLRAHALDFLLHFRTRQMLGQMLAETAGLGCGGPSFARRCCDGLFARRFHAAEQGPHIRPLRGGRRFFCCRTLRFRGFGSGLRKRSRQLRFLHDGGCGPATTDLDKLEQQHQQIDQSPCQQQENRLPYAECDPVHHCSRSPAGSGEQAPG